MMKKRFNYIFMALTFFFGCTKEEVTPRIYPRVSTIEAFDITSAGASFKGEITFSSVEIKDHGFVWSDSNSPTLGTANKISIGPGTGTGDFEIQCDRSLQEGRKYYLRAYALSEDFIVYGNTVEFVSLGGKAPVVKNFYPSIGTWSDTITLVGENFSDENRTNIVKFGDDNASVVRANKDTLFVKVPDVLTKDLTTITVSVAGNSTNIEKQFQLRAPVIESVTPDLGLSGTKVVIKGKYLLGFATEIFFGEIEAAPLSWSGTQIECLVPNMPNGAVALKVQTGTGNLFATSPFKIQPENLPELNLVEPTVAKTGEIIKLIGNYFATEPGQNSVKFDNTPAYIVSESKTEIEVMVPEAETRTPTITVTSYGSSVSIDMFTMKSPIVDDFFPKRGAPGSEVTIVFTDSHMTHLKVFLDDTQLWPFSYEQDKIRFILPYDPKNHAGTLMVTFYDQEILNQPFSLPWIIKTDFPGTNLNEANSLIYNNGAYVGLGGNPGPFNQLWKFDGTQWDRLTDFPGADRFNTFSFIAGTKAYVGGGDLDPMTQTRELWEYNFASDSWSQRDQVPLAHYTHTGFSVAGEGYAFDQDFDSNQLVLWKYNQSADTWSIKSVAPFQASSSLMNFVIGNSVYVVGEYAFGTLWKYTPTTNQWTSIASIPGSFQYMFSIGALGYGGNGVEFYKFNPATNTWTLETSPRLDISPTAGFSLNGKGYMLGPAQSYYDKYVYEYDPNY